MQAGGPQGKRIPSLMDLCLASAVTGKISLQHPTKGEYTPHSFPQFPCAWYLTSAVLMIFTFFCSEMGGGHQAGQKCGASSMSHGGIQTGLDQDLPPQPWHAISKSAEISGLQKIEGVSCFILFITIVYLCKRRLYLIITLCCTTFYSILMFFSITSSSNCFLVPSIKVAKEGASSAALSPLITGV